MQEFVRVFFYNLKDFARTWNLWNLGGINENYVSNVEDYVRNR